MEQETLLGEGGFAKVYLLVGKIAEDRVAKKMSLNAKMKDLVDGFKILKNEGAIHKEVQRLAKNRQRSERFLELISMWFLDRCSLFKSEFICVLSSSPHQMFARLVIVSVVGGKLQFMRPYNYNLYASLKYFMPFRVLYPKEIFSIFLSP